jgi:hypothetical protein
MKQSSALEVQKLPFYIRIQEGSGDYRPLIKSVNGMPVRLLRVA